MKHIAGLLAVMLMVVLFVSGCQSIEEKAGQKLAENMLGQALGGDVTLDDSGNVSIKTKDGEATLSGGEERPKSVPDDLPSLPGGKDYSWMGSQEGGLFAYTMTDGDFVEVCDDQIALMKAAGWQEKKESFTFEMEGSVNKSFYKTGLIGSMNCNQGDGEISLLLSKTIDVSAGDDGDDVEETDNSATDETSE